MKRSITASIAIIGLGFGAAPLFAQGSSFASPSMQFLKAVESRDGNVVSDILSRPGTTLINTRGGAANETALHIVVKRRDLTWMRFMLAKGANPNLADKAGNTPLMLASQLDFLEGAELLLAQGAQVDLSNQKGETPLIRAIQLRQAAMAKLLVARGANPDKADYSAGLSARDYAARDDRTRGLKEALEKPVAKPVRQPRLATPTPNAN